VTNKMSRADLVQQLGEIMHVARPTLSLGEGAAAEPAPVNQHYLVFVRQPPLLGKGIRPPAKDAVHKHRRDADAEHSGMQAPHDREASRLDAEGVKVSRVGQRPLA
jgi:hypothetical protein